MIQSTSNDNTLDSSQPTLLLRFVEELVIRDTVRLDRHVTNGRAQRTSTQLTATYFKAHKLEEIKTQTVLTVHLTSSGSDFIFLTETWKCTDVEVRGYRSIIKDAKVSKTGGRNSGGIVCCRKIYFMIGFQLSKHRQIFFGLQSTKDLPTQRKISTFVVFIFYRVAQNILTLNYLKN